MHKEIEPQNLLFIMSDEHNPKITGCYGHKIVETPNLDKLAAGGTLFTSAYTNSPICVPARAALATGRYVHKTGQWDNASAYQGVEESWHHTLRDHRVDVASIGKLHFRGGDDYGFTEELLPLHVLDGIGDLKGLLRKELPPKAGTSNMANDAGAGDSSYNSYDARIADRAVKWLEDRAGQPSANRFVLFVSFVMPHFPLIAPEEYYDLYEKYSLDELREGLTAPADDHPTLNRQRHYSNYEQFFDDDKKAKALRAYFGMVSILDHRIGQVIEALGNNGFGDNTRIVYTSDHGDNLGSHGMWGKSVMYENAARVPMIVSGKDIPAGERNETPVTLVDIAPTSLHATGVAATGKLYDGASLIDLANNEDVNRPAFAEYHASGSDTGQFMLRKGEWKLVYFAGQRPQLFHLPSDPLEVKDLWDDPQHQDKLSELKDELFAICNPDDVSAQAFADQRKVIDHYGGMDEILKTVNIPYTPAPE